MALFTKPDRKDTMVRIVDSNWNLDPEDSILLCTKDGTRCGSDYFKNIKRYLGQYIFVLNEIVDGKPLDRKQVFEGICATNSINVYIKSTNQMLRIISVSATYCCDDNGIAHKFDGISLTKWRDHNKLPPLVIAPWYEEPVKRCIIDNCTHESDQGKFIGDFCAPCHEYVTTKKGIYSQAYRNQKKIDDALNILKQEPYLPVKVNNCKCSKLVFNEDLKLRYSFIDNNIVECTGTTIQEGTTLIPISEGFELVYCVISQPHSSIGIDIFIKKVDISNYSSKLYHMIVECLTENK